MGRSGDYSHCIGEKLNPRLLRRPFGPPRNDEKNKCNKMVAWCVYYSEGTNMRKGGVNMKEREFWIFLNGRLARGRMPMVSGSIDCSESQLDEAGKFMGGHSYLPDDHDRIPLEAIMDMGKLLLGGRASIRAKEAILIILAHHPSAVALNALKAYNAYPDKELRYFAEFAQQECEMSNI